MSDLPILFSAPMVRGLLREIEQPGSGKTQTRRIYLPRHPWDDEVRRTEVNTLVWPIGARGQQCGAPSPLPRYHVGDRLYVREHWRCEQVFDDRSPSALPNGDIVAVQYEADGARKFWLYDHLPVGRFRQGMHMPRWASRITLTVTDVRVERLQDISEADAIAEGVERLHHGFYPYGIATFMTTFVDGKEVPAQCCTNARDSYSLLWDSINGRGSWEANPFVAVYTFTVALGNIDQIGRAA